MLYAWQQADRGTTGGLPIALMQPRVKYITKGRLAGLVRAAPRASGIFIRWSRLVKSIGDDDPPSALVTDDIRNGILTAELWTEMDVRRGGARLLACLTSTLGLIGHAGA